MSEPIGGDPHAVGRALIALVADLTWATRGRHPDAQLVQTRDEAMALLPAVTRGDTVATKRASELVRAMRDRAA
jgi:methyl coenzyme M reductase subunit C